jgi:hypothetical protein
MTLLDLKKLQTLRTRTFNLPPQKRVSTPAQALTFVNRRASSFSRSSSCVTALGIAAPKLTMDEFC